MSYVLITSTNDVIWFDAITDFSQTYAGKVTQHPVEDGSVISDHFIRDNVKLAMSCIISNYDFNISNPAGVTPTYLDSVTEEYTAISSTKPSLATKLLPSSLGGVLNLEAPPEVTMFSGERKDRQNLIKTRLLKAFKAGERVAVVKYTKDGHKVSIDSFGSIDASSSTALVITNLTFPESAENGDALYMNISLEEITLVKLLKTTTPKYVAIKVANLLKDDKGNNVVPGVTSPEGLKEAAKKGRTNSYLLSLVNNATGNSSLNSIQGSFTNSLLDRPY